MISLNTLLVWFSSIALLASAHMEMSSPYPLRSRLNPHTPANQRDYDMVAPLLPDGSDYPCKNYHRSSPGPPVATYIAGKSYRMSITGNAPHHGGSCQLSLSYDRGQTFKVIKSMIGGCPTTTEYDFTVPVYAPTGSALFAWTWFNLVGNREMYMNCAEVRIEGGQAGVSNERVARNLNALPDMFVANVGAHGRCTTAENHALIFPDAGPDVTYGDGVDELPRMMEDACDGPRSPYAPSSTASIRSDSQAEPTTLSVEFRRVSVSDSAQTTSRQFSSESVSSSITLMETSTMMETFTATSSSSTSEVTTIPTVPSFSTTNFIELNETTPVTFPTIRTDPSSSAAATLSLSSPSPIDTATSSSDTTLSFTALFTSSLTSSSDETSSFTTSFIRSSTLTTSPALSTSFTTVLTTTTSASPSSAVSSLLSPTSTSSTSTGTSNQRCDPGSLMCPSRFTFAMCNGQGTGYIFMGSVALGTVCTDGKIVRAGPSPRPDPTVTGISVVEEPADEVCTTDTPLRCVADGQGRPGGAFQLCDQGVWVDMGPAAAGTVCQDGRIVAG